MTEGEPLETEKLSELKKNNKKKALLTIGVVFLVLASFVAGSNSADSLNLERLGIRVINQEPPGDVTTVDYGLLWETLAVINDQYVDKPVDQKQLMYGAVEGLLRALKDPHSTFLDPEENRQFLDDLEGNFEGIGAEISLKDESITVVAPLPGTPAEKAGVLSQDIILKIDDEETFDMSLEDAVSKIRGPKGTTVVLTVLHKGDRETREISIKRDEIHIESVISEVRMAGSRKVGIIKLTRFGPDTKTRLEQVIPDFKRQGIDRVILDLRNNPGGLLDSAVEVSSFWVSGDKVVLKELHADKKEFKYHSKGDGQLAAWKTVVLINGGSASASEIVTGALQDHKLAVVVGEKSYGKGSVQDLIDVGEGASVKITIAKWLTPNGRSIDKQGLEPDVEVEMTLEDYENDRDPQMEKALELASQ